MFTNECLNLIIITIALVVSIITLFFSTYYNRRMLKQTKELSDKTMIEAKELYKKLINAQLFNSRYDVIQYFIKLFNGTFKKPESFIIDEFELYQWKMQALFKDYQDMSDASISLVNYFRGHELYDYTSRCTIKPLKSNKEGIEEAFCNFYLHSVEKLEEELGMKK